MSDPNRRRSVFITGASTGIGRACTLELARRGFDVFAGVRREEDGRAVQADAGNLSGSPGKVIAVRVDVTDLPSICAAIERITEATGDDGLCGVINNAGISVVGPVEFVPLTDWRRQFDINFFGVIAVTQAVLPLLRKHVARNGKWSARLVNMSSIAGRIAQPILGPYTASKHALESLSDSLRIELRPQGIHVCSVNPGAIDTPIWNKAQAEASTVPMDHPSRAIYGQLIDGVTAAASRAHAGAIQPCEVAKAVAASLIDPKPRTRYFVGKDAKSGAIAKRLIPDRMFDSILEKYFAVRK
jgi:NAD(P)-dependent dehydrogenase (short-subunit alcohol dehydrogenase family)